MKQLPEPTEISAVFHEVVPWINTVTIEKAGIRQVKIARLDTVSNIYLDV